jgi:hypothetical protein
MGQNRDGSYDEGAQNALRETRDTHHSDRHQLRNVDYGRFHDDRHCDEQTYLHGDHRDYPCDHPYHHNDLHVERVGEDDLQNRCYRNDYPCDHPFWKNDPHNGQNDRFYRFDHSYRHNANHDHHEHYGGEGAHPYRPYHPYRHVERVGDRFCDHPYHHDLREERDHGFREALEQKIPDSQNLE